MKRPTKGIYTRKASGEIVLLNENTVIHRNVQNFIQIFQNCQEKFAQIG